MRLLRFKAYFKMILLVLTLASTVALAEQPVIKPMAKLDLPADVENKIDFSSLSKEVLPKELPVDPNAHDLISKIADNGLAYYWRTSPLRDSQIGQAAVAVEKKLNVEAKYVDSQQISHHLNFKILAMQSMAKIEYAGWVNANVNYNLKNESTETEVVEPITDKSNVIVSHTISNIDRISAMSFNWKW